jgi:hypothetical protein
MLYATATPAELLFYLCTFLYILQTNFISELFYTAADYLWFDILTLLELVDHFAGRKNKRK